MQPNKLHVGFEFNYSIKQLRKNQTVFTGTCKVKVTSFDDSFIKCQPLNELIDNETGITIISTDDVINVSTNYFINGK